MPKSLKMSSKQDFYSELDKLNAWNRLFLGTRYERSIQNGLQELLSRGAKLKNLRY